MTTLDQELANAWGLKALKTRARLHEMKIAPGLFKPETVRETIREWLSGGGVTIEYEPLVRMMTYERINE